MANPLRGLTVLLLEDEVLLRKRIAGFLEGEGAEVTVVGTVAAARHAAAGMSFDVALLDVNLPDGRGTDLLRDKVFPGTTTVFVITSEGGVAGAIEALRAGAADYLVKPFDPEELPVRLAQARRGLQAKRVDEFRRGQEAELFFGESLAGVREQLDKIAAADRRLGTRPPPGARGGGGGARGAGRVCGPRRAGRGEVVWAGERAPPPRPPPARGGGWGGA